MCNSIWFEKFFDSYYRASTPLSSDHTPLINFIGQHIVPLSKFMFKNYWVDHKDYLKIMARVWISFYSRDPLFVLSKKLKDIRASLGAHKWEDISLNQLIMSCKQEQEHILFCLEKELGSYLILIKARRISEHYFALLKRESIWVK